MTGDLPVFEAVLPPIFGVAAVLYLSLAAYVSRLSPRSMVPAFMFLLGVMVAGCAFYYGATDPQIYGVGRILTFLGAGFLPVVFYTLYRQLADGEFSWFLVGAFSIIPTITLGLALTNPWHGLVWQIVETADGPRFTAVTDHYWFRSIHAPFSYGLFGYSVVGLMARLTTIPLAYRNPIIVLLVCAVLPFGVSIGNTMFGIGPIEFPFTVTAIVMLLPLHIYAALSLKVFQFNPLGYRTLFNHVRDPIIVLDQQHRIVCANASASEMLGKSERQLLGGLLWEDFPEAQEILTQSDELDLTQTLKFRGDLIYEVTVAPLNDKRGRSHATVVMCRDVTQRRRTLGQLAENEHLIRTLIETSSNGILRFALDEGQEEPVFRCIFANKAAEDYLAEDSDRIVGVRLTDLPMLGPDRLIAHFSDPKKSSSPNNFELSTEDDEGSLRWLRITAESVGTDFSVTIMDITQRKENEDRMMEQALRDPLTSVLNRRGFETRARERLREVDRAAIIYLDLNGFKMVNDKFGHQAGDALLKAFGHRLGYCLRPEDVLGRLGGDEFAIVLPDIDLQDIHHVTDRLIETSSDAYLIKGREIRCSVSVGVARMPEHGEELWHLISVADQAMYTAKAEVANEDIPDPEAVVEDSAAS